MLENTFVSSIRSENNEKSKHMLPNCLKSLQGQIYIRRKKSEKLAFSSVKKKTDLLLRQKPNKNQTKPKTKITTKTLSETEPKNSLESYLIRGRVL